MVPPPLCRQHIKIYKSYKSIVFWEMHELRYNQWSVGYPRLEHRRTLSWDFSSLCLNPASEFSHTFNALVLQLEKKERKEKDLHFTSPPHPQKHN